MAESFENLDNILRDWAKDKEALNRDAKQEEERKSRFRKSFRENTRAVSVGSRARLSRTQNWS